MTDITVIILTGKEELHIGRCLKKLAPLEPRQIIVVESQKGDRTHEIASQFSHSNSNLQLIWHDYPGNQAAQFQWALDQLTSSTSNINLQPSAWIIRLEADEYLTDELIAEIKTKLPRMEDDVDGVVLKRRHVVGWLGDKWVKRGMYPTRILRLSRAGHGRSDMKIMDEHIVVDRKVVEFEHDFVITHSSHSKIGRRSIAHMRSARPNKQSPAARKIRAR